MTGPAAQRCRGAGTAGTTASKAAVVPSHLTRGARSRGGSMERRPTIWKTGRVQKSLAWRCENLRASRLGVAFCPHPAKHQFGDWMDRHPHPSVTRCSLFVIRSVLRLCVNERTRSVDLKPSTVQPCNGAFLRLPASIRPRAICRPTRPTSIQSSMHSPG